MTDEETPLALPEMRDVRWWWAEGRAEDVTEARSKDQFDRWLTAREAEQRSRIAALEAVIQKVTQLGTRMIVEAEEGYWVAFDETVDAAPPTVFEQVIREAKAEALREAEAEVRAIPCWGNGKESGFDVGPDPVRVVRDTMRRLVEGAA